MVFADTLLSYSDWKLPFICLTDTSDKQVGVGINQNSKILHSSQ